MLLAIRKLSSTFTHCLVIALSIMLVGCGQSQPQLAIAFQPVFASQPVNCATPLTINNRQWQLSQLQFYVSNVSVTINGQQHPIALAENQLQQTGIALLGEACGGSANWHLTIATDIAPADIQALSFDIGVPEAVNHLNPLQQQAPLNQSDMFWTWQLGHKFFRLDLETADTGWSFHSGSMGCQGVSPLRTPNLPCKYPNRAQVKIATSGALPTVFIHLDKLVAGLTLNAQTRCMSSPDEASCAVLLTRLGVGENSQVFTGSR